MKALQKVSKFLSDYTSVVVIAIAVVTFFVPTMMGWVNNALFVDPVSNKFTCQSIIIGVIMFSMGLTLTTEDFKMLGIALLVSAVCVAAAALIGKAAKIRPGKKVFLLVGILAFVISILVIFFLAQTPALL